MTFQRSFRRSARYRVAAGIVRRLHEAGHAAYLVGGCVRDLLLGVAPKDFDVATSARPEQVRRLFKRTIPVGAQFGVMLVLRGRQPFEVATFRSDLVYRDGRRPEGVVFSDPKQDALRRDFTVNALFFDPVEEKVIDFCGGRKDLRARVIRAIGEPAARFREDRLRILRAVRFAANLDFEVEPATWRQVKAQARFITQVSRERIRDELVKLFTGPKPGRGLTLLDESGLLKIVLPEVAKTKGVPQPPEFHPEGDVFVHTRMLLDLLRKPTPVLAMGALLHDVGKPPTFRVADRIRFDGHDRVGRGMAQKICRRLRFSNDQTEAICELVGNHMRFKDVRQMRVSTLKRFLARPTLEEELKLHRADCLASHGDLSNWRFLHAKRKELGAEEIKPAPLLTGHDLLKAGYPEGPLIGEILRGVEEKQLEGELTAGEEALDWVKRAFPMGGKA